jgi:hypothetical protein
VSEVDSALLESYKATVFRVWDANSRISFHVENENSELDKLLAAHGAQTAAFITAYNPGSQVLSPDENDRAHQTLLGALRVSGWRWMDGDGADPQGQWIPETSVMILGIDKEKSTKLAMQFGQNAYVWIQLGEPPHLVLTR